MRVTLSLCIIFLLLPCTHSASAANSDGLTFLTHFIRPFSYEKNREIQGFAVEIVKELMEAQNHPTRFEMVPFIRGLKRVQEDTGTVLFIVARRPEREKTVKWVGPLVTSGVFFYKRSGSKLKLSTLDDLKNVEAISVGRGNADHTHLQSLGFSNLYPTNDQMQSLEMLVSKRVNVTPISELVMPEMAKQAGINVAEIAKTRLKLYDSTLYLAFSLDTPNKTVSKWQQALDDLKRSGRYQKLYNRFFPSQ